MAALDDGYVIPAGAKIGHVHLKVADIDRSLDFYCGVLGFELQAALWAGGGVRHAPAAITTTSASTRGSRAAARRPRRAPPASSTSPSSTRPGASWPIALHAAARRQLAADGASDHGVSEALYLRDPDQNGVELYWDRPRDQWPQPDGENNIPMVSAPLDLADLLREAE